MAVRYPMLDRLLRDADREEALSRAYASAVAAGAGYVTYVPDVDRDSVDIGFAAGGTMRPNLHAQLKATVTLKKIDGHFSFQLKKKNYDDLRIDTQVPRVLLVLRLPRQEADWLNISVARLILRQCAFWVSLKGAEELPEGQESVSVKIPEINRFDVDGLTHLMAMARSGNVQ